jgi:hypothetical protein
MRTEPLAARSTEELLERYARLSLERDELAARVAELERELGARRPVDTAGLSRSRDALVWLGVVLASALTLGVVLVGAAIVGGFWDPLEDDQALPALTAAAPLPTALPQPGPEPSAEPSPPISPSAPPPTLAPPPAAAGTPARAKLVISAARGDSWLQVRRRSTIGRVVFQGILSRGDSKRFSARRLWFRFGVGDHLEVKVNGKPTTSLPSLAGSARATSAGVRVLAVG